MNHHTCLLSFVSRLLSGAWWLLE